ncbi:MAG: hypothetical protein ACTSYA_13500 [Candidatus Kariarchaeaceae archaeon]
MINSTESKFEVKVKKRHILSGIDLLSKDQLFGLWTISADHSWEIRKIAYKVLNRLTPSFSDNEIASLFFSNNIPVEELADRFTDWTNGSSYNVNSFFSLSYLETLSKEWGKNTRIVFIDDLSNLKSPQDDFNEFYTRFEYLLQKWLVQSYKNNTKIILGTLLTKEGIPQLDSFLTPFLSGSIIFAEEEESTNKFFYE